MEDLLQLTLRFAAALGLGVLLGLERERAKTQPTFGGVRTLGMLGLAGGIAGFLDVGLDRPWLALAIFAATATLVAVSYVVTAQRGEVGITTEVTALLAFLVGYLCLAGHTLAAAVLTVAITGVLASKERLHALARRIEPADVEATVKFAIVTLVVLPLVPNRSFGPPPLDVVNPFTIWLMVALISGINFGSYVLVKTLGPDHGIRLTGLLGGLVSSTALTLGFAQRSRQSPRSAAAPLALGILIAWSVMFARVVVLVAAVAPWLLPRVALAMLAFAVPSLAICGVLWRRRSADAAAAVSPGRNPFALRQAIRFGLLYGAVMFGAKAAHVYLGTAGLYLAAALAGLTDVDAIALSMAQLAAHDPASSGAATRSIVIAVAANTVFKAGLVAVLGAPALRNLILAATAALLAAAAAVAWLV